MEQTMHGAHLSSAVIFPVVRAGVKQMPEEVLPHSTLARNKGDRLRGCHFQNPVGGGNSSGLAEHRMRAAVLRYREFDGAGHCLFGDVVAADHMLDGDRGEDHRVRWDAGAVNMYLIVSDLLALLAQNRDDIHRGADSRAHQKGLFGPPAHFTTFGMKIPGIERDGKRQAMEACLTGDHRLLLTTEAELAWIRGSVSLLTL